jgi:Protein of unknown function (DUF2695)
MTDNLEGDEEFIASITPDVMRALTASGLFIALDNLFCPTEKSLAAAVCHGHGDYRNAKRLLLSHGFAESDFSDIFGVLASRGGYCDCEILYNAAESSRLKAEYWQAQARNSQPSPPKHRSNSE